MAKVRNPRMFSSTFHVAKGKLQNLGVFDPVLNADTRLFIDPLLFPQSAHSEFSIGATARFRDHFTTVFKLLSGSRHEGDAAWKGATRMLEFHEIRHTCLGYGESTRGSAFGRGLQRALLRTAKEIINLGVTDPDLFVALALLEERVGADRISDMATNVALEDISAFTTRIASALGLPMSRFVLPRNVTANLPENPCARGTPVLLLPKDILRQLPVATDWDSVCQAASDTQRLRNEVNQKIGDIWSKEARRQKHRRRELVLKSKAAFDMLLRVLKTSGFEGYDFDMDRDGMLAWREALEVADNVPLSLSLSAHPTKEQVFEVVRTIIAQFGRLVADNGLWKLLWSRTKPRSEKAAQLLFFAVATSYCDANRLDVTPEADSGHGPVDFKFVCTPGTRVLVEVKLSKSNRLVQGYQRQLELYKKAERTTEAAYLVIDLGDLKSKKRAELESLRRAALAKHGQASEIFFVDGSRQVSASKA